MSLFKLVNNVNEYTLHSDAKTGLISMIERRVIRRKFTLADDCTLFYKDEIAFKGDLESAIKKIRSIKPYAKKKVDSGEQALKEIQSINNQLLDLLKRVDSELEDIDDEKLHSCSQALVDLRIISDKVNASLFFKAYKNRP